MAQYPYLPLFVTDYRSATDHLTDAEHGIYLQLLMLMWQSPDCRIPDDDDWIARRLRRTADAVRLHVRPLMHEFCTVRSGWVIQKRLQKEWQWRKVKSEKSSDSAKSRWNKEKQTSKRNTSTHSERNAPTLPYPTPQIEVRKKDSMVAKATVNDSVLFDDFWKAYPKRRGSNPKEPARIKFEKIVGTGIPAATIITGAANYAAELRRDGKDRTQYTAQAVTWLNQLRFNDYQQTGDQNGEPEIRSGGLVEAGRRLLATLEQSGRNGAMAPGAGSAGDIGNATGNGDVRLLPQR